MRVPARGNLDEVHEAVAAAAAPEPGRHVLEIGCGDGAVTARLVSRGATVTALDRDRAVLAEAERQIGPDAGGRVEWVGREASAVDTLPEEAFDAVVASLCLSEMDHVERGHVLRHARQCLKPDGVLVVADAVEPAGAVRRALHRVLRLPQAVAGRLGVVNAPRPIADLDEAVEAAGFRVREERRWQGGSLALLVAERWA